MMDNINQPVPSLHTSQQFGRGCLGGVNTLPFAPDTKGLLSPGAEGYGLDHSRGDDFLAGEAAPCHWIQALLVRGLKVTRGVAGKVADLVVGFEFGLETFPVVVGAEELNKWLRSNDR